jgi:hypothetical protein
VEEEMKKGKNGQRALIPHTDDVMANHCATVAISRRFGYGKDVAQAK